MIHNYETTSDELKQCPFCGGTPMWYIKGNLFEGKRTLIVKCARCGAEQRTAALKFSTTWLVQKAKEKWNLRTETIPKRDK